MRIAALLAAALLAACGGTQPPAWQSGTHDALERFSRHYLAGESRFAARSFDEAMAAAASTGKPDLVARIELVRCALGTAALDFDACAGFAAMASSATSADRAYAQFLSGRWDGLEAGALPAPYRAVLKGDESEQNRAIGRIEDPVSRLVAAGALFRAGRLTPAGIETAAATASDQGWRRPLLAYLKVQAQLAEQAGDGAALAAVRKRIDLVSQPPPGNR